MSVSFHILPHKTSSIKLSQKSPKKTVLQLLPMHEKTYRILLCITGQSMYEVVGVIHNNSLD